MKTFFKNILSTIIGMVSAVIVIVLLSIGIIAIISSEDEVVVKENSILKIDFSNTSVVERTSKNPFSKLNLSGEVGKTIAGCQELYQNRRSCEGWCCEKDRDSYSRTIRDFEW